jgi:hypothetical protein
MAFSLHAHYCAEHVGPLAARVREMRQPPYGLDTLPDPALAIFFDELLSAPGRARAGAGSLRVRHTRLGRRPGAVAEPDLLHRDLDAIGIPHEYRTFAGEHSWSYWMAHLEDSLLFFEQSLARS